ncbi:hypothetical protein [Paenibacillus sp. UNC499MF]|uniref:hypothetical protein n=1 Tax=Paenibacillus sp. UNC499MF TaxID=1502751 RepID=UPI0008A093F8|nr:hypothetical protein [Paenibacillus sp. UNC499MF]SEG62938.1 hypothetical protein SAMN02799616_03913 [Paenibacillus sp. UNC499MF]
MSLWLQDLKGFKSIWGLFPLLYVLMLGFAMWNSDPEQPGNALFYGELAFYPLVVMLCAALFHRELDGPMEIYAAFPLSLAWMPMRKGLILLAVCAGYQASWFAAYQAKFGAVTTLMFPYGSDGQPHMRTLNGFMPLLMQMLPALLFVSALTVTVMLAVKKLYAGLFAGLAFWMLDILSHGSWFPYFTIYTVHLQEQAKEIPDLFLPNRLALLCAALILSVFMIYTARKRSRWIVSEEE